MAEINDTDTRETASRWYCHTCESETEPTIPDYTCSQCHDGFIEPTDVDIHAADPTSESSDPNGENRLQSPESGMARVTVEHSDEIHNGRPRHTRITIHRTGGPSGANPFQDFLSQFVSGLMDGGGVNPAPVNIQFAPMMLGGNAGDYVFSAGGLDNVITMLMNQIDGAGPPPATKDQIDALPISSIVQEQVDSSLQCNICMEDFQLDEPARSLPCKHVFHGDCIVPWLQLHGTCPICRTTIEIRSTQSDILPD